MRKLWLGILATLLVVVFVAPSFAWEFSMTGEFDWRHNYVSRMGTNDIFGDATLQDNGINPPTTTYDQAANPVFVPVPNGIGFAGPSIYSSGIINQAASDGVGLSPVVALSRGGYSSYGDAAWIGDQRLTFVPNIRVNNAIRISGTYTVGGFRNKFAQRSENAGHTVGVPPFERYHALSSSTSAYNTAAIGSWELFRATVQVPWGTIAIGVRDFPFGTGISYANNTPTSSTLLVVPYGPFRFLGVAMLSENWAIWQGWHVGPDTDRKKNWRIGAGFTFENGPLSVGALWLPEATHILREFNAINPAVYDRGLFGGAGNFGTSVDSTSAPWNFFLKYNNGRFFANAEYYFSNTNYINNYTVGLSGAPTAGLSGPRYQENNKWMAEIGALAGPAKISLAAFYASGQTLPGVNVNTTSGFNTTKQYTVADINYQALQPYSFLMFPTYGGGNNRFSTDAVGQMGDAFALAGRIDYAAAANLNLWGTYMHARRAEKHGYYAGSFNGMSNVAGVGLPVYRVGDSYPNRLAAPALNGQGLRWVGSPEHAANFKNQYGGTDPFVADDFIGWEAQAGVDWKLLENFTAKFGYSYWQLGPWFDQAYQAFTANTPNGFLGSGILVGRDPIQSVRGSLTIDF